MSIGTMLYTKYNLLAIVGPYVGPWLNSNGEGWVRLNSGIIERSDPPPYVQFTLLSPNTLEAFLTNNRYVYAKYTNKYEKVEMGIWQTIATTQADYDSVKVDPDSQSRIL